MIDTLRLARGQRLIAISDVHGHIRQLHALLDKVQYCDADALVFAGDYIERGAQSLPVLEFVAQLYARNPQNVRLLLGNWDMGILSAIEKGDCALLYKNMQRFKAYAGNTLYNEMCARVGMDSGSESTMRAAHSKVMEKFGALIRFFLERPIVLDAGEMVFVHGGLPHGGLQALDPGHPYGCMKFDDFLWQDSVFARPVVFGHMPVVNGRRHVPCALPYFDARRNVIGIDGGCGVKHEGQLNALLWRDGVFSCECVSGDLPVVRAKSAQAESADSLSEHYFETVSVLGREGPLARVRHEDTGRVLWTVASRLWQKDGKSHAETTDYALSVEEGDLLRVVYQTPRGLLAQKNGVTGWYYGAWEA